MRLIGLTGGIASGKSTVAVMLRKLGAEVIDADQLARDVVVPGEPAYAKIVSWFGTEILTADSTIDRAVLGNIVFADAEKRRCLELIVHPAIRELAARKIAHLREDGAPIAVYMAPLLIEAGTASRVEEIWVVYVDENTQLTRLMARDGCDRETALRKIGSQMSMEEKKRLGTVVIDNRGTLEETERQVRKSWRELEKRSLGQPCKPDPRSPEV